LNPAASAISSASRGAFQLAVDNQDFLDIFIIKIICSFHPLRNQALKNAATPRRSNGRGYINFNCGCTQEGKCRINEVKDAHIQKAKRHVNGQLALAAGVGYRNFNAGNENCANVY
jgi:hypothetical protein